jgi:hypothetical protein
MKLKNDFKNEAVLEISVVRLQRNAAKMSFMK